MRKVYLLSFLIIVVLFSACSSGNKFASSFGKRKYTKGYYVDNPGVIKTPTTNAIFQLPITHRPVLLNNSSSLQILSPGIASKNNVSKIEKTAKSKPSLPTFAHFGISQTIAKEEAPAITNNNAVAKTESNNSGEYNFYAIAGFVFSVAGTVVTVSATVLTPLSIVLLAIGTILCIYSLFIYRIYFSWLAILGLSITIILFVLVFV